MKDALGAVQSVLVLGGGSEIAAATLRELTTARFRMAILAGPDPKTTEPVAEELRALPGVRAEYAPFDAAAPETHERFVNEVFSRFGDIDLALMAFGVLGSQDSYEQDPAAAARAATVNYVGAVSAGLAIARRMRAQGHGTIVVLSSVAGQRARRSNFVYGSSKAGLDAFAMGLGDSLVGSGVRVVVVRPGFVVTRMTKGMKTPPFSSTPQDVARAIGRALANGHDVVWVPPFLRWMFLVLKLLPRAVFRRLPI